MTFKQTPKRVFRFRTFEEFEDWKITCRLGPDGTPEQRAKMRQSFRDRDAADCAFLQRKIDEREGR